MRLLKQVDLELLLELMHQLLNYLVAERPELLESPALPDAALSDAAIAKVLGIHPATVSYIFADKVVQTPRGLIRMRQLAWGKMSANAPDASSESLADAIRNIIESDKSDQQLDDEAVSRQLRERGWLVGPRIVASYRAELWRRTSADSETT